MSAPTVQSGTITSAVAVLLPLILGERYLLLLGYESDDFDAETVTPKLCDGINAGNTAQGTLTVDTQVTAGDTFTIGSRVYTFIANGAGIIQAEPTAAEIEIGTDLAGTLANIVAAINGTDDKQTADPLVSAAAFASDDSVITARQPGLAGNAIATTETFTAGTNVFDAGTLGTTTAGTDSFTGVSALPTVGSSDSDGSPLIFSANGQIEFAAGDEALLLVMSGAPTSVRYKLVAIGALKQIVNLGGR